MSSSLHTLFLSVETWYCTSFSQTGAAFTIIEKKCKYIFSIYFYRTTFRKQSILQHQLWQKVNCWCSAFVILHTRTSVSLLNINTGENFVLCSVWCSPPQQNAICKANTKVSEGYTASFFSILAIRESHDGEYINCGITEYNAWCISTKLHDVTYRNVVILIALSHYTIHFEKHFQSHNTHGIEHGKY
jgi:hypothetical protein